MIRPARKKRFFQISALKRDSPYNWQTFPVCCGQLIFLVIKDPRPVRNRRLVLWSCSRRSTHPICLPQASVHSVYGSLFFGNASTGGYIKAFTNATAALFFSSKGPNCFGLSFLNFLLSEAGRHAKHGETT